jgi:hypothetical protein
MKLMKVRELFDVKHGVNLELMRCEIMSKKDYDSVNFVARTSNNNGVVAKVKCIDGIIPHPAGVISCAAHGSVMSSFVQVRPFYSGRALYVLTPKHDLILQEKLYYCMCLKANAYRYNYGRSAEKTLPDIELPDTIPEWVYNVKATPISTSIPNNHFKSFEIEKWGEFRIGDS